MERKSCFRVTLLNTLNSATSAPRVWRTAASLKSPAGSAGPPVIGLTGNFPNPPSHAHDVEKANIPNLNALSS
jgi:hypothetical protein